MNTQPLATSLALEAVRTMRPQQIRRAIKALETARHDFPDRYWERLIPEAGMTCAEFAVGLLLRGSQ